MEAHENGWNPHLSLNDDFCGDLAVGWLRPRDVWWNDDLITSVLRNTEPEGRGHPGINYMDVGGGLELHLKLRLSVMFLSKGDFPLIHTFISPCSPGWCLITAVHCFFIQCDRQFLALVWRLYPFNKNLKQVKDWRINKYQGKSRSAVERDCVLLRWMLWLFHIASQKSKAHVCVCVWV